MAQIAIVGYEQDARCAHCNRPLLHGIRISDGRTVGASCLDKQLTKAKSYQGKQYRLGAALIINAARVVEFKPPSSWQRYGVSARTIQFDAVDEAS